MTSVRICNSLLMDSKSTQCKLIRNIASLLHVMGSENIVNVDIIGLLLFITTNLSKIIGSEGVSFLLPHDLFSRQRLHISSWVNNTRRKSGFLLVPSYGIN